MTIQNQTEAPSTVFDIVALIKQHAEPLNIKIAECLVEYRAAKESDSEATERKQRRAKQMEALISAAEAKNMEVRANLRDNKVNDKADHKNRAERNGILRDIEIVKDREKEDSVVTAAAKLRVSRAAAAIFDLRRQQRSAVCDLLSDVIANKVKDEFRAIAIFVNLVAEIAAQGDSDYYNTRRDVFKPMDFALEELAKILRVSLGSGDRDFGSKAFLAEIPEGLRDAVLSPLTMKKMEDEIAAMEAAL